MVNLSQASWELFRRTPDECFDSLSALSQHCQSQKEASLDRWHPPQKLVPHTDAGDFRLALGNDGAFACNDWSFSQLCRLGGVNKETVNRLSAATASKVLQETLPVGNRPLHLLTTEQNIRSIHGVAYTRLWNADLLSMVREFAVDFQPPQTGIGAATGLYCGEQDLFCFMIDPNGWTEIGDQAFAPGFFVWNSEVGKRSLGISTFWFQAVCKNHIVWDAVEVVEFSRKHTSSVYESLGEIRNIIEALARKRDERKDGFANVIRKAMQTRLGSDAAEVEKVLSQHSVARHLAKRALEIAQEAGRFTLFSIVDALTRLAGELKFAGDRTDADQKAASLLSLAA
jgi:hypothetical protein